MTTTLAKKINKEVQTLRRDVAEIKSVLLSALAIPEESIREYKNVSGIKKALNRALKKYPAT